MVEPERALELLSKHAMAKATEMREDDGVTWQVKRAMGQRINLVGDDSRPQQPRPDDSAPPPSASVQEAIQALDAKWSVAQVGRYVLHLEAKRVEVYATFEALRARPAEYAAGCGRVTADFATLSDGINHAEAELRRRGKTVAAGCVRRLQLAEKEKLELTAAVHATGFRGDADGESELDYVRGRLGGVVSAINGAIEDLKAETMDEGDS